MDSTDRKQKKVIYFDNNATTRIAPEVFEAMTPFLTEFYGNPSSIHRFGGCLAAKRDEARENLGTLLGAKPEEIIFTSCGTESDSTAIRSALSVKPERKKIVVSKVEHPAVLNLCKDLERRGFKISTIPVDAKGRLDMERAAAMIDLDTAIVSVMWANNETGNIHPIIDLAEIAHRNGALFHTDAVQAVGKITMNLSELPIDMLSLSGHKFHAPKGIGALYVKRGVRFHPFLIGGHQECGRRAGTENLPGIIGLGKAAELARTHLQEENTRVKALRDRLEAGVLVSIPSVRINGDPEHRLPNTSNISFEFIEGESILMLLDLEGICASSGSACTTGSLEPSHVLRAMGVPYTAAHGSIRFSFSRYNTVEEVDFTLSVLPGVIERLRNISPYWKK